MCVYACMCMRVCVCMRVCEASQALKFQATMASVMWIWHRYTDDTGWFKFGLVPFWNFHTIVLKMPSKDF